MKKVLFLFLLLGCNALLNAQIQDQSHLDKSFWEFKAKLDYAAVTEDTELLKSLFADKVVESNNGLGEGTPQEMIDYLFEDDNSSQLTWEQLRMISRFGFSKLKEKYDYGDGYIRKGDTFFKGPSYLTSIDEYSQVMILGERVNIREKPSLKANIIHKSSYEIFNCDCDIETSKESTFTNADGYSWLEIYLKDGRKGYVVIDFTSQQIYKSLTIAKVNGEWKIVAFYHPPGC